MNEVDEALEPETLRSVELCAEVELLRTILLRRFAWGCTARALTLLAKPRWKYLN